MGLWFWYQNPNSVVLQVAQCNSPRARKALKFFDLICSGVVRLRKGLRRVPRALGVAVGHTGACCPFANKGEGQNWSCLTRHMNRTPPLVVHGPNNTHAGVSMIPPQAPPADEGNPLTLMTYLGYIYSSSTSCFLLIPNVPLACGPG